MAVEPLAIAYVGAIFKVAVMPQRGISSPPERHKGERTMRAIDLVSVGLVPMMLLIANAAAMPSVWRL
jgi:hypothetical protein